uniref:(northern house mosquito) hypothetical protein n=1 Tax=Culex pipiens TaxID=7175 RepID=A0A8D8L3L0_CULPI
MLSISRACQRGCGREINSLQTWVLGFCERMCEFVCVCYLGRQHPIAQLGEIIVHIVGLLLLLLLELILVEVKVLLLLLLLLLLLQLVEEKVVIFYLCLRIARLLLLLQVDAVMSKSLSGLLHVLLLC